MSVDWTKLFKGHVHSISQRLDDILSELGGESLVLSSGEIQYFFEDDQEIPYRPNHHFSWLCPYTAPGCLVHYQPGEKPHLLLYRPSDFWYEQSELGDDYWTPEFKITEFSHQDDLWKSLAQTQNALFHGPNPERARSLGMRCNLEDLIHRLNWDRSFKTEYEVAAMREANELAAVGHKRASTLFYEGASEMEIYHGFHESTGTTIEELAYTPIIALNEKGAFLHYQAKRPAPKKGMSLLIDAGLLAKGYASDITRTYAADHAPDVFKSLINGIDAGQQKLCTQIKPDHTFIDIHEEAHRMVGQVLIDHQVIKADSGEQAFQQGVTELFLPHGFGHLLGLHVHDVGGRQIDRTGTPVTHQPYRYLRSYRTLHQDMAFTVEPGVYFNSILLDPHRQGPKKDLINWQKVDELRPCGGIRIEDNVVVTDDGFENLTRPFLP
jgi:Xaa-Pro dipeptidase